MIEAVRNGVQIVVEQVGVDVQGHSRGRVPEHALHRLDVGAGLDREARRGVPEVVRRQAFETDRGGGTPEPSFACLRAMHVGAAFVDEQQVERPLAGADLLEHRRQRARERHRAPLVGLRRPDVDLATDLDRVLRDEDPPPDGVDVLDPEAGGLAPPQPAVGEEQNDRTLLPRGDRELAHLLVGEVAVLAPHLSRQLHAARWVRVDPSISDGHVEDRSEHPVGAQHGGGSVGLLHRVDPGLRRLRVTEGAVDTDRDTAGYLIELVAVEARSHLSEINVVTNAVLRHLATTLIEGAPPSRVLEIAHLTDDQFWALPLAAPNTSELAQALREDPLRWSAAAVEGNDVDSADGLQHTVHRLYLDLPLVNNEPADLPVPDLPPTPVRYRITAHG